MFTSSIRLLSKLHLLAKIALFGIFFVKFFDHMSTYALKIFQKTCSKSANFFKQSKFRKKSIFSNKRPFTKCLSVFLSLSLFFPFVCSTEEPFDPSFELYLSNVRQLTFPEMGFQKAGEAYFSPDGQTIAFQAVPFGCTQYQIYTMKLDEGLPTMVSTGKGACTCAFFRPDGQKIIFASSHEDPNLNEEPQKSSITRTGNYKWDLTPYMNVYEANLDGTDLLALTNGPAYHAECAYSSDGKSIVYASNEDGSMNIYTMNADGSNQQLVTHTDHCYNGGPFFSPDDQSIVFRSDREEPDYLQIYVIKADGTDERQLTYNSAVNWAPYWHPNGQVIAFTTSLHGHHRYQIYLLNVVTGKDYRLTHSNTFEGLPVFSPDGKKMMWTSKRGPDHTCQVFIADFTMPSDLIEPSES